MRFRHPSRDRLKSWLDGAEGDDPQLDAHLESCTRCATVIEAIAEPSGAATISDALLDILSGPPDLSARLERQVVTRLGSREWLGLMAELFGAGVETGRMLIEDPPSREET
jgi:hypothetical protein